MCSGGAADLSLADGDVARCTLHVARLNLEISAGLSRTTVSEQAKDHPPEVGPTMAGCVNCVGMVSASSASYPTLPYSFTLLPLLPYYPPPSLSPPCPNRGVECLN